MFLFIPPPIDIDNTITQVKYEIVQDNSVSSTCLTGTYQSLSDNEIILNWEKYSSLVTNISPEYNEKNISTWEEINIDDFDLTTKLSFTKSIKVKSKIKTVSKYNPTIVID